MSDPTPVSSGLFGGLARAIDAADGAHQKPTMNMAALLELPDDQRRLVRHLLRADERPTESDCARELDLTPEQVRELVGQLSLIGLVETVDGRLKAVAGWRASRLPPGGVWSSLEGL